MRFVVSITYTDGTVETFKCSFYEFTRTYVRLVGCNGSVTVLPFMNIWKVVVNDLEKKGV